MDVHQPRIKTSCCTYIGVADGDDLRPFLKQFCDEFLRLAKHPARVSDVQTQEDASNDHFTVDVCVDD